MTRFLGLSMSNPNSFELIRNFYEKILLIFGIKIQSLSEDDLIEFEETP